MNKYRTKAVFNWSGGKDSALALWFLLQENDIEVQHLLTNFSGPHDRVSMHGVRRELMLQQAEVLGFDLLTVELPEEASMEIYNQLVHECFQSLNESGIRYSVFGDIFLEDLKAFREEQMEKAGMRSLFPIWKRDTLELVQQFITLGFKAITVCVDNRKLDQSFVGREIDEQFISELPEDVDPCGENGEFHTFVYNGPIFREPVTFKKGKKILRYYTSPGDSKEQEESRIGYWFCDLIPR